MCVCVMLIWNRSPYLRAQYILKGIPTAFLNEQNGFRRFPFPWFLPCCVYLEFKKFFCGLLFLSFQKTKQLFGVDDFSSREQDVL